MILFLCFLQEGAYVAQYKFTVLLMPNGPHKITGAQNCATTVVTFPLKKPWILYSDSTFSVMVHFPHRPTL